MLLRQPRLRLSKQGGSQGDSGVVTGPARLSRQPLNDHESVAQSVEHSTFNRMVLGSSPSTLTFLSGNDGCLGPPATLAGAALEVVQADVKPLENS